MNDALASGRPKVVFYVALIALGIISATAGMARADHSARALWGQDQVDGHFGGGVSTPTGPYSINVDGNNPGYFNGIPGNEAVGSVSLASPATNGQLLVGIAIHVTDTAGPSHSLSTLNDPALNDILLDLQKATGGDTFGVVPYAYNNAPSQYSAGEAVLSAGESANNGQPFDILLATGHGSEPPSLSWLSLEFHEVNNLDGITSLSVTDVGAVPEPGTITLLSAAGLLLLRRRPNRLGSACISHEFSPHFHFHQVTWAVEWASEAVKGAPMSDAFAFGRLKFGFAFTLGVLAAGTGVARADHSAYAAWGQDLFGAGTFYGGTSDPTGRYSLNIMGGAPGYINDIASTPSSYQSAGSLSLAPPPTTGPELIGVAIHVSDTAGSWHSLSDLNDPALADIAYDINYRGVYGDFVLTAYPYAGAPSQYAGVESLLSGGETANGGQPFDILLVAAPSPYQPPFSWLSLGFNNEVGSLDGISAIGVTDIGAVPEPGTVVMLPAALFLLSRRRNRVG